VSIHIMSQIWDLSLPDSEKLVALALADWCNDDGICWPSTAQIARKSSKSERTVQGVLAKLESRGILCRDMRPGKGTLYKLTPAAAAPRNDCTTADIAPQQGTTQTPAAAAPNTSITINTSHKTTSYSRTRGLTRKAGGFGPPNGIGLDRWNEFCAQRKKPVTQTAYTRMLNTLIDAADAGWPPGEVIGRAIERGWETLFVPNEAKNGKRTSNHSSEDAFMVAAAEVAFGDDAGHGGAVVHLLTGRAGSAGG